MDAHALKADGTPRSAREEIAELRGRIMSALAESGYNRQRGALVLEVVDVLLTSIERQAEAIVKLQEHVAKLDERTRGLVHVGGR